MIEYRKAEREDKLMKTRLWRNIWRTLVCLFCQKWLIIAILITSAFAYPAIKAVYQSARQKTNIMIVEDKVFDDQIEIFSGEQKQVITLSDCLRLEGVLSGYYRVTCNGNTLGYMPPWSDPDMKRMKLRRDGSIACVKFFGCVEDWEENPPPSELANVDLAFHSLSHLRKVATQPTPDMIVARPYLVRYIRANHEVMALIVYSETCVVGLFGDGRVLFVPRQHVDIIIRDNRDIGELVYYEVRFVTNWYIVWINTTQEQCSG